MTADVGDHPTATGVTVPGQPHHALHREIGAVAGLEERKHIACCREGLQATPVSAPADGTGLVEGDVPDFARRAAGSAVDLPVDHQTGADTAGDLDVRQVPHAPAAAPDQLAEGAEVGVVVHVHRYAEPAPQLLGGPGAAPAGQDRGGAQRPGLHVDRAGHAEAHPGDLGAVHAGGRDQTADQLFRPVEALGRGRVDVQGLGLLGEHLVGEVADGDAQVGVAEVHADDDPGVAAQRDAAGPPAARGGGRDLDRSAVLQLPDDVGDRGRGQARRPRDLRLRERTGEPYRPYDAFQVGSVQRRLRPGSLHDDLLRAGPLR